MSHTKAHSDPLRASEESTVWRGCEGVSMIGKCLFVGAGLAWRRYSARAMPLRIRPVPPCTEAAETRCNPLAPPHVLQHVGSTPSEALMPRNSSASSHGREEDYDPVDDEVQDPEMRLVKRLLRVFAV